MTLDRSMARSGSLALLLALSLALGLGSLGLGCESEPANQMVPEERPTLRDAIDDPGIGLIYVPAYTYAVDEAGRIPLVTTLMIHNVSAQTMTIHSVRYYDATGILVEAPLDTPRQLAGLETLELRQESPPTLSEGAGANFLVGWTGQPGMPPLVEALMVGHHGAGRLTFTSRGVEVGLEASIPE